MPTCVVPGCNNSNLNSQCSFYRFPVDENIRKKWVSLIRRSGYTYNYNDRICSWHFPNGKEDGPIRFDWNERTSFAINFPEPTKVKREKKNIVTSKSKPVKISPIIETIKVSKRKQVLEPNMYAPPKKLATSNLTSTPMTLREKLCTTEQKLAVEEAKSSNLEVEVDRLYKEKHQLELQLQSLTKDVKELKGTLKDADDKINYLRLENTKCKEELQDYKEVQVELLATKRQVKSLEKQNGKIEEKLADSIEAQENCISVCKKFKVAKIQTWSSQLLSSFTGFQDYSSIQTLCHTLAEKNVTYATNSEVIKVSFIHQLLLTLMKLRLDMPHSVLGYIFGVSSTTTSVIFNSFLEAIHQMYYENREEPLTNISTEKLKGFTILKTLKQKNRDKADKIVKVCQALTTTQIPVSSEKIKVES